MRLIVYRGEICNRVHAYEHLHGLAICRIEHLQEYLRQLDESSDDESSDEGEEPTQMQKESISLSSKDEEDDDEVGEVHDEDYEEADEDNDAASKRIKSTELVSETASAPEVALSCITIFMLTFWLN